MMHKLFSIMTLTLLALLLPREAAAFSVSIYVENIDHVTVSTARGVTLPLENGSNDVTLEAEDSPLTIAPNPGCKINTLIVDSAFSFPYEETVQVDVTEGTFLKIMSEGPKEEYTLVFTGDFDKIRASSGERLLDPTKPCTIIQDEIVSMSGLHGYDLVEVTTTPEQEVQSGRGTWVFFAQQNLTVNVVTREAPEGNVIIDIDDPANATVTTAQAELLQLNSGENYVTIRPEESPLKVKARPGAKIEVVADPTLINPDKEGVYTVNIDPAKDMTNLYIVTSRSQSNTLTVNVNNASEVNLTDGKGNIIPLFNGTNVMSFDFSGTPSLTAAAVGEATLVKVLVDDIEQEIAGNTCTFTVRRNAVVDIITGGSPAETGWVTIVDEDFSGFPEGTYDEPALDTTLLLESGDFMDPARLKNYNPTCTRPWGGMNLYPAGGSLAVVDGFLNTPTGDYSGKLRMTFRARLIPDLNPEEVAGVEVLLIRRSAIIDYKRQTFTLTGDWQTFSFEADNGWFHDTCIQFFSAAPVCYELDDIRIEHHIGGIEPPRATEATDITDTAFTANWIPTDTADSYLLSVYTHGETPEPTVLSEDFENVSADADGHIEEMPLGWEYNLSAYGDTLELNEDPDYASGSRSICLDASGDYIQTPSVGNGISSLSYTLVADDRANAPAQTAAVLNVGALTDGGWQPWLTQSMTYLAAAGEAIEVNVDEYLGIYDNIYAVRFELEKASGDKVLIMIDDIRMEIPGIPEKIYLWEDYPVEGPETDSCRVEDPGYDNNLDYFYSVKARNERYISEPSEEIEVFMAQIPVALPATGATETSFTANWECGSKADEFDITLYRSFTTDTDMPEAVILDEDFGRVHSKGTAENPETGAYTTGTVSLDDYTRLPGWTATSYSLAEGAVGGLEAKEGYQVGGLITPTIDLSNDGGRCILRMRAWFNDRDAIQVQGNSSAVYAAVAWNGTGWKDLEFEFANCGNAEKFTIWSGFGKPFMIDHVSVIQNLRAGDKVDIQTDRMRVPDASARSAEMTGIRQYGDYEYSYDVCSRRYFHGDRNDLYLSHPSNRVKVNLEPSARKDISDIISGVVIRTSSEGMEVILPETSEVRIYDLNGRCVASAVAPAGSTFFALPGGVYIVRIAGRALKAAVR